MEERSKNIKLKKTSYKQDNLFTGLIHCAEDGAAYWLKVRTVRGKAAKTWVCSHRIKQGAVSCRSKPVKEEILLEMISDVYNNLAQSNKSILLSIWNFMRKRLTKQKELKKKLTTYSMK